MILGLGVSGGGVKRGKGALLRECDPGLTHPRASRGLGAEDGRLKPVCHLLAITIG